MEARSPNFWPLNSDSALANSNMRTGSLSSGMRGLKSESCFFTSLSGRVCKHVLLVLCEKGRQVDGRAGVEEGGVVAVPTVLKSPGVRSFTEWSFPPPLRLEAGVSLDPSARTTQTKTA